MNISDKIFEWTVNGVATLSKVFDAVQSSFNDPEALEIAKKELMRGQDGFSYTGNPRMRDQYTGLDI